MSDSYTANDTITITDLDGEWILADLATDTTVDLVAPNELSTSATGYNGNGLGAHNEPGRQRELTLRLVKGSYDDKRLNSNYTLWQNRDSRFVPLQASFTKNIAHSDGTLTNDTVNCFFGLPAGQPQQTNNVSGDTEQVVSTYLIRFANSERIL